MHHRNFARARIMREMLEGLSDEKPVGLKPLAADPVLSNDRQHPAESVVRWWRVGRYFRRQEGAHTK